ncbi:MAG: periplasmic heavy metal sensor [Desulfamplus sp.]|nr:periplasmic heavy metal sensor [Desulfamplus sp.]
MKKQTLIKLAVIFTILAMAGTALAWGGAGKRGRAMDSELGGQICAQDWANLTDDQKSQLKALHQKFIDETATTRASMVAKHEEIRIFMETTSPDKAKLHALSAEIMELKKQVMDKKIDMALEAKKIAPELDISMIMMDGHGKMGKGKGMMGKCNMMEKCAMMANKMGGMGKGMGMMGNKGMGKMNCPAMSAHDNTSNETSTDAQAQSQDNNEAQPDHSAHTTN